MRDFLTIGLEHLTGGRAEFAAAVLRKNYVQTIFKAGFDQAARLRERADRLAATAGFKLNMLDTSDQEFAEGLRRFKPLLLDEGRYRNFQSIADVEHARARLDELGRMVQAFLALIPDPKWPFARSFNTATVQLALSGTFAPVPLKVEEIEKFLATGFKLPKMDVPGDLQPFAERWWNELRDELTPLVGSKVDPRFVGSVVIR
jgi:hypothetical protein